MRREASFDNHDGNEWPEPEKLKPYFFGPKGEEWFENFGNDTARLSLRGLYGTESLEPYKNRVDVNLVMGGIPGLGVLLFWQKYGGGYSEAFTSKGDLTKLGEWVRSLHDTPLPVGLFIPFSKAWLAVKEFIETDGELPKSIEWVANRDLPAGTFPDP